MELAETIKYFIVLLETVDLKWIIILLFVLIISCICPCELTGKVEAEEKDGKTIYRIFRFK